MPGTQNSHQTNEINNLFHKMWLDYIQLNPEAEKIHQLLQAEGEEVLNDHIALRTFRHPKLGIESFAKTFENLGFRKIQDYQFKEKKLYAWHYTHPDPRLPKVFISELKLEEMSPFVQSTISEIIDQIDSRVIQSPTFSVSGRTWKLNHSTYEKLYEESEYAAWVSAIGFRPNHFTVNINHLKKLGDIHQLNTWLENKGFRLNSSGGKVKGSPEVGLEQSSTMAPLVEVEFNEGLRKIPGCYYEFAKRYPQKNGELYQGFVAASADKIFESTNR